MSLTGYYFSLFLTLAKPRLSATHPNFPLPAMASDGRAPAEPHGDARPLVVLLGPLYAKLEEGLSGRYRFLQPSSSSDDPLSPEEESLSSVTAILTTYCTPVDAAILARLPLLRCVVTTTAGINHIDLAECRRRGVAVANAGSAFSEDAADYAVALALDVLRRVSSADRYVRRGSWSANGDFPLGFKLSGKRVGILGLGSIGSEIATRLEAFNCVISYHSRTRKPSVPYPYHSTPIELAANCDILVLCCTLSSATHHIVNRDVLEALGKHGIVINVGRGALIDEIELVRSLAEGRIGGAGLDVFQNEPTVPPELFQMDNVVLSPHVAVCTEESTMNVVNVTAANLEAFFSGKPLACPVSL